MTSRAERIGWLAGVTSYVWWGLSPAFFKLLAHVPPPIVIGHRVVWAALFLALFLAWRDGRGMVDAMRLPARRVAALTLTGTLVSANWLLFVWAVGNGQVLATSLGYFINPLVTVLLGMLILREPLDRRKRLGVAIAAGATAGLGVYLGEPPWIALGLAFSFGLYGLFRKMLGVRPLVGLLWETLLLLPAALVYLVGFAGSDAAWGALSLADRTLLAVAGLVTIVPLIAFNMAAQHLRLVLLGFLQYLAPSLSFGLAIFVYDEPFGTAQLVAFGGIWIALVLFTWPTRRRPRATVP